MTWYGWFLLGWWAFVSLLVVGMIGRKRDPITPASAVATIVINALFIWGLVTVGTGSL